MLSQIRNLFCRSALRKSSAAKSPRLGLETLTERVVPAVMSFSNGVLSCVGNEQADTIRARYIDNDSFVEMTCDNQVTGAHDYLTIPTWQVKSLSMSGQGGNDTITNDTRLEAIIYGNDGHDVIFGGTNKDTMRGDSGNDALNGRGGYDTVVYEDARSQSVGDTYASGDAGYDTLSEVERAEVYGTSQADSISLWDFHGQGYVKSFGGNDTIWGSQNGNVIYAGEGDDTVYGGAGQDYIEGGNGNDTLKGYGDSDVIYGGDGNDKIEGGDGNDDLHGGKGNDKLKGNGGDDDVHGDEGTDQIWGGSGKDHMYGGADYDYIWDFNAFVGDKWEQ